jgi:hypothetical protein
MLVETGYLTNIHPLVLEHLEKTLKIVRQSRERIDALVEQNQGIGNPDRVLSKNNERVVRHAVAG